MPVSTAQQRGEILIAVLQVLAGRKGLFFFFLVSFIYSYMKNTVY